MEFHNYEQYFDVGIDKVAANVLLTQGMVDNMTQGELVIAF